jgi:ubiquinone/menaquinone biosynthesis C-methylase UbiE
MPRGNGRDAILDEYSHVASRYDSRWSFYIEATTRETLSRLPLRPADRLLDVGCGTGALLAELSRIHPPNLLAGVDPSPEMLAVARRKLPEPVELLEGWAEELPFPDERFDVVVSCNVFHYIRHPLAALKETRRVLRSGGRLVITDWCDDYLACRICDWYLRFFDPAHFRVYGRDECLRLLEQAGCDRAEVERYRISWLWGLMTAKITKETL